MSKIPLTVVGAELLRLMRLDGFVPGQPSLFDEIARMAARVRHT